MPNFYDQMNPGQAPAAPGTQGYQQNIVNTAATSIRPQFEQALTQAHQGLANRGMDRGGLNQYATDMTNQGFNHELAGIAGGAATHSADLANQQQNVLQEQGWQQGNINKALDERRRQFDTGEENKQNAMWADLIGSTVGGVMKAI